MKKLAWIDSVRGMACLIVLFAHIFASDPNIAIYFSGCGKIGVWLFFIISAFLLTLPYLNQTKVSIKNTGEYYLKRIFRIYPCYLIVLIISLPIGFIDDFQALMKHTLLLEGTGHFWTIPVEIKFYLILPLIVWVLNKISSFKWRIIFIGILGLILECIYPYFSYKENSILLRWYFPVFLMGMIVALIYNELVKKNKSSYLCDVFSFVIIIGIIISTPGVRYLIFGIAPDGYLQNKYLFMGIAWSVFFLCVAFSKKSKIFFGNSKFLSWIGKISFPFYLVHYIVLQYLNTFIGNVWVRGFCTFIISAVIAWILNQFVENPMIKYGRKVTTHVFKKN